MLSGKVNARLLEKLKTDNSAPYHDKELNFTSVSSRTPTKFPTLSVVSMGEPTADSDLEHIEPESVWSTIELTAYTNTLLSDADKLITEAGKIMFRMGYEIIYGPANLSDTNPYSKVARYRRKFGKRDILY